MRTLGTLLLALCAALAHGAAPPRPLLRTYRTGFVAYPEDCNHLGILAGRKTFGEMDRCAGIAARRLLWASPVGKAVTSTASMTFRRAGKAGDLVEVTATVIGAAQEDIIIRVLAERVTPGGRDLLANGLFVFKAWDERTGKAAPHGLDMGRKE